jgi:signal transduction histidine kinase
VLELPTIRHVERSSNRPVEHNVFNLMNDSEAAPAADRAVPRGVPDRRRASRERPTHVRAWVAAGATVGAAVTLLLNATSLVHFAYRSIPLHVAVETTATMASLMAAQLVYGRFRGTLQLRDLVLFASMVMFAGSNLCFSAVPALLSANPGNFRSWAPIAGSLAAVALLAIAAFATDRTLRRPDVAVRLTLLACATGLAAIAVTVVLLGEALPQVVTPRPTGGPRAAGNLLVVTVQLVSMLLFAAAAAGFAARAERTSDVLARWLAVGATLGAFARLNYALFPSLYTNWFYAGDILRLGCYLAVFAGAVQETWRLQRALAASAVLDERHRIARNIHDGVAQDLAFLVQQLRRLGDRGADAEIATLVPAAERALDESRHAVAALSRPVDRTLGEVIAATAREAGEREGSIVEIDVADGVAVPARTQEELVRIVRESVINAARHGGAEHIRVQVRAGPNICVSVRDNGRGFDPGAPQVGRMGLASIRARAQTIGGKLTIWSEPGSGAEVRVTLP